VTRSGPRNIVSSVQARLVQRSHELVVEHQLTLARYGGERLLYRLSKTEYADRFVLKGAALLLIWLGEAIRPTKDVDLLGLGDTSADALERIFIALCGVDAPEDGLTFLPDSSIFHRRDCAPTDRRRRLPKRRKLWCTSLSPTAA